MFSNRRWAAFVAVVFLSLLIGACVVAAPQPGSQEAAASPTAATVTPAGTATRTPVWFPPTATYTLFPTPVMTPTLDLRPQVGETILTDDFSDESQWTLGKTASTSAALGKNELTLALSQPDGYITSLRKGTELGDFYLEITASPSLCSGADEYGLLLRVTPSEEFYRFSLTCDGQLRLDKYAGAGRASSPHPLTPSGSVPRGAPSFSRLAVWAQGKEMRFFINEDLQFTIQDPSLFSGRIGVFARSEGEGAVTVSFSDLVVKEVVK